MRHWFGVYLLYILVRNATSLMDVAAILRAQSVSPRMRARGLLRWSRQIGEKLNSLSNSLEEELVQVVDCCLDSPNHILQPLSATC